MKTVLSGLCAFSVLTWIGCSSPTSSKKTACACEKDKGTPGTTVKSDAQDSLIKAAKTAGRGVVTGALQGEGKDVVKGLLKTGMNAAGERRYLSTDPIPLSGATILIFDALQATTAAETTLTTDKDGKYSAILKEGRYYGFAVHLDLQTFRLVTASIPFINPKKDTIAKLDTAVAIEDNSSPTVTGVYDATSPDATGLFIVGPIPASSAKLSIVFSEPMQRESIKGITIGKVDVSNVNGAMVLKDTLPGASVIPSWSGDSKQLTLTMGRLEADSRYGIILPTSLKDLARNPLEKEYHAIFEAVPDNQLADIAFSISSIFPADKDALKPNQNPQINFSRPPQVFSALRSIQMDPKVEGYWEVNGSQLSFVHKDPFPVGATYTVAVPDSLVELGGKRLDKAYHWTFTVKDYDGAAKDKRGRDQAVALLMEDFFNAYLQGDVGRLSTFLDPAFRLEADGQFLSSQQFLDRIRTSVADKNRRNAGFLAPIFDSDRSICSTKVALRKVASLNKQDTLWIESHVPTGILPKVYRKGTEVTSGLTWSKTDNRVTLDGRDFLFDLPSSGSGALDNSQGDPRYVGEQLRLNTSVVLDQVKDVIRDEFNIDGGITVTETDAKAAVKLSTITAHGRSNWDPLMACAEPVSLDTTFRVIKFILGYTGTKWVVNHAVDDGNIAKQQFTQAIAASDFKVKEIKPITLVAPISGANGAGDANGNVTFRFKGLDFDSVGGYLVGLAEDPKFTGGRAAYGGLFFVKNQGTGVEQNFVLGPKGQVVSGATAILRDVQTLQLPGWERTNFKFPITELFNADNGLAGVYQWKAIAIRDTSASQFLSYGFSVDRFYGESDFGPSRGSFAVKGYPNESQFNRIDQQTSASQAAVATAVSFADRDLDGFPDYMEINYKTNPDDKGSFPNFLVDTDRDGIADFLEMMIDPAGVEVEATDAEKKVFFQKLQASGVKWVDTDGDGFPDDIEKLLGYNPNDSTSKPATHARVSAPAGVYAGLIKLGDNSYPIKFKVKQQQDTIMVSYSAYLKDTLSDTVRAGLNETMGEFLFPIRLPDNGPDSGKSLLLRGTYDKTRAFLSGAVNRIGSVAKTSSSFGGGPFVGQYAASGRGEDVSAYLGINANGSAPANPSAPTTPVVTQPGGNSLAPVTLATMTYRKPPSGLGNARFFMRSTSTKLFTLIVLDEFGDTTAVLDSTHCYPQDDGSFDIDAKTTHAEPAKQYTRKVEVTGRLGRGKDSLTSIWVLDGSLEVSVDSCRKFDPSNSANCLDKLYRDVPGQFSSKVAESDASVKSLTNGVVGDFSGWLQQDNFGTGLSDGSVSSTPVTPTTPGQPAVVADPTPPESFANPFPGGAVSFRTYLDKAGIAPGDVFYVSMRGRVMRTTYDSVHVRDGAFPYCGDVQIFPTPIPLLDGSTQQEKDAFTKDSILATSPKYAVIAIEDEATPGTPALLAKARDALGFVRTNAFLIEARYVDPNTLLGGKCIDGGLPPPSPIDAGLPTLPTGAFYYRGDLEILRTALSQAGNQITVVQAAMSLTGIVDINPATLRIDPDTKAAMVADANDPSLNYVLLAMDAKTYPVRMAQTHPSALQL